MAGCPLRGFEECPEHSKKGGCQWWLSYSSNTSDSSALVEGCAVALVPILQIEHVNASGRTAGEIAKLAAETSEMRSEGRMEGAALRRQLYMMAGGDRVLVSPSSQGLQASREAAGAIGEG